ncbi:hypothetical protein L1787_05500 [Acuticoccus sp. M5D2P5]|uniref:hypothetical protein n=1 Tax=Acuticoccus kalidii TaxID=2910977 RepID=UPI001F385E73|nr:hypothetical protein [Acuticoccus kalidii]MCF3932869.1 hypothetical protein [Acuticoccus kalidii]
MKELLSETVNFSAEIAAIKQKFGPTYHREPKAIEEAAQLWGLKCNPQGVIYSAAEDIKIEHKGYSAAIRLYGTGKGYWHVSLSLITPQSGFGTPATVWGCTAFTNALAARKWGLARLLQHCRGSAESRGADARLAVFLTKLEAERTPQLALF